jgi:glycyl-tRNA synthetase beta subunit
LWRHLCGWASHINGVYKQRKVELQSIINDLDIVAEIRDLTEPEQENIAQSRDQLTKLLREEEIKYYHRAKVKDILLGDNNTRYFQIVTNGKYRKNIFSLNHANGIVEGQANLKAYITRFYKELFGEPERLVPLLWRRTGSSIFLRLHRLRITF